MSYIILQPTKTGMKPVCFSNGDVIIYDDKREAIDDMTDGERLFRISEEPKREIELDVNVGFRLKKTVYDVDWMDLESEVKKHAIESINSGDAKITITQIK